MTRPSRTRGEVVDLGDGQAAVHRAVAGDENFVFDAADVNLVAIHQIVIFRRKRIQEILHRARKLLHLLRAHDARAERLDVNVDARSGIGGALDLFLELRGLAVRLAQAGVLVHFEMQLDEEVAFVLVRRQFVDGEAAALRDGANRFEQVLVVSRARLDVDHDVRGNDPLDACARRRRSPRAPARGWPCAAR